MSHASQAAEVLALLCDFPQGRSRVVQRGGLVERLLTMTGEESTAKTAALRALLRMADDDSGRHIHRTYILDMFRNVCCFHMYERVCA